MTTNKFPPTDIEVIAVLEARVSELRVEISHLRAALEALAKNASTEGDRTFARNALVIEPLVNLSDEAIERLRQDWVEKQRDGW